MGDRCVVNITILKKDREALEKFLGKPDESFDEGENDRGVELVWWNANHGFYDEIGEATEAGLTFTGSHGAGCTYAAGIFVSHGGDVAEVHSCIKGDIMVRVSEDGTAHETDLQELEKYRVLKEKALKVLSPPLEELGTKLEIEEEPSLTIYGPDLTGEDVCADAQSVTWKKT